MKDFINFIKRSLIKIGIRIEIKILRELEALLLLILDYLTEF